MVKMGEKQIGYFVNTQSLKGYAILFVPKTEETPSLACILGEVDHILVRNLASPKDPKKDL